MKQMYFNRTITVLIIPREMTKLPVIYNSSNYLSHDGSHIPPPNNSTKIDKPRVRHGEENSTNHLDRLLSSS